MSDSREAFEQLHAIPSGAEWCEKRHIYIHKNYSGLVLHPINESWEAFCEGALWQASREEVECKPADLKAEIRTERDPSDEYVSFLVFVNGGKSEPYLFIPETLDSDILDEVVKRINTHPASAAPDEEYLRALQDACDIIQADANTEENYGSLCRIGAVLVKLRATPAKADDWIKCSDRRPNVLDVWIKMTDGSVVACCSQLDGDFYWNGGGFESYILENTVTHWKPRQQEQGHE